VTACRRARDLLQDLEAQGLQRSIPAPRAETCIDFSSNDYLGLARSPDIVAAMAGADRVGASGARLLSGAHPDHAALEEELARLVRRERALLFSSGYLAALGATHTAAHLVESAYSDADNHASIIDGLRLTRLARNVFAHLRPPQRKERASPSLIISETVFGMSGEQANIVELLEQLKDEDLLLLDEAHALGIHGAHGSGLASAYDDERIIILGTLSKAFGCAGGFIAGPHDFIEAAINTARSFIFDTAMPPGIACAARAALRAIVDGDALRARLSGNITRLVGGLHCLDSSRRYPHAPIISLIIGDTRQAIATSTTLRNANVHAPAIRPPTVPTGASRIRLAIRADHTEAEIMALLEALRKT
jgi:8-amino-7-oxononanoate synthase